MLTPMSITSLDQGRDLAHWQIGRLYAEPEQQIEEEAPNVVTVSEPSRWHRIATALVRMARALHGHEMPASLGVSWTATSRNHTAV
ncbi:hypothetical protein [Rhizobium sp. LjRoot254]|uniref:hypothetical protein n=1 Tax=Rhizobium sp. LjRoot254 TaxID=3342297 RepID=UPI003ED167F8